MVLHKSALSYTFANELKDDAQKGTGTNPRGDLAKVEDEDSDIQQPYALFIRADSIDKSKKLRGEMQE